MNKKNPNQSLVEFMRYKDQCIKKAYDLICVPYIGMNVSFVSKDEDNILSWSIDQAQYVIDNIIFNIDNYGPNDTLMCPFCCYKTHINSSCRKCKYGDTHGVCYALKKNIKDNTYGRILNHIGNSCKLLDIDKIKKILID